MIAFPARLLITALGTALAATWAPSAFAQPGPESPTLTAPAPDEPMVSVTMSPIHLVIPMLELSAEVRILPRFGVAVIAGGGATRIKQTDELIKLVEGGISPRYYVWGSFRRGLQVGAELLYLHAIADDFTGATISASGLSVSPYVGYKWTHRSGFTFEAQGGVSILAIRGEGQMTSSSSTEVGPLVNLQVGWSL